MSQETKELAPLPSFRVHQEVRYMGFKADVVHCWWDEKGWRYEVHVRRGKSRGYWTVTEETLKNEVS